MIYLMGNHWHSLQSGPKITKMFFFSFILGKNQEAKEKKSQSAEDDLLNRNEMDSVS